MGEDLWFSPILQIPLNKSPSSLSRVLKNVFPRWIAGVKLIPLSMPPIPFSLFSTSITNNDGKRGNGRTEELHNSLEPLSKYM